MTRAEEMTVDSAPSGHRPRRRVGGDFTGLGLPLAFFGTVSLILTIFSLLLSELGCSLTHPTDETLVARFFEREAEFERLLAMVREDGGQVIYRTWTENPHVSRARGREYRSTMKRLSVQTLIAWDEPQRVRLFASSLGLSVSGSSKGFVYLERKPDSHLEDLDHYRPRSADFEVYRHLKGNWYLFLDGT